jgi:DNA (cytosine-5)-methyltransferase 1
MSKSKKRLNYISFFSGAGGLDLGIEYAGFNRLLAVEKCTNCVNTLLSNGYSSETILNKSIEDCKLEEVKKYLTLKKSETLDLLVGGPPCQPFSKSGFWLNGGTLRMNDPRANTLIELMKWIRVLKPKNVLIENVLGIKYKNKDEGFVFICDEFKKINQDTGLNYELSVNKVNAVDYGIPQKRERVFIIANSDGRSFQMPKTTHSNVGGEKHSYISSWDAIGDLNNLKHQDLKLTNKWAKLLPSIPEGNNYQWHTDRMGGRSLFGWRTRYWSFLLKLDKRLPSWTITANPGSANGPFHWKNRKLSIREMARIQTFPDTYNFEGSYNKVQKQIGNAVPPLLAEIFGNEIRRQFIDGKYNRHLNLVINKSLVMPTIEAISNVPNEYLNRERVYKEHPGTGKGPGFTSE